MHPSPWAETLSSPILRCGILVGILLRVLCFETGTDDGENFDRFNPRLVVYTLFMNAVFVSVVVRGGVLLNGFRIYDLTPMCHV